MTAIEMIHIVLVMVKITDPLLCIVYIFVRYKLNLNTVNMQCSSVYYTSRDICFPFGVNDTAEMQRKKKRKSK